MTQLNEVHTNGLTIDGPGNMLGRVLRELLDNHRDNPLMITPPLRRIPRGCTPNTSMVPLMASQSYGPSVDHRAREDLICEAIAKVGVLPRLVKPHGDQSNLFELAWTAMRVLFPTEFDQSWRLIEEQPTVSQRKPWSRTRLTTERWILDTDLDDCYTQLVWAMWLQARPVALALADLSQFFTDIEPVTTTPQLRALQFYAKADYYMFEIQTSLVVEHKEATNDANLG